MSVVFVDGLTRLDIKKKAEALRVCDSIPIDAHDSILVVCPW